MSKEAVEIHQQTQPSKDDRDTNGIQKAQITVSDFDHPISHLLAFVAVMLQLAVIVVLIVFNIVPVWIQKPQKWEGNSLSNTDRLLYLTGTTILATIIASFTIGQIRRLWFAVALSTKNTATLDRKLGHARTLIGLASLKEMSRYVFATVSFWLTGLMTAAIVAGISPTSFPSP